MGGENRHLPAPSSLTRMARSTDTSKRPPNTVVVDHEGNMEVDEHPAATSSTNVRGAQASENKRNTASKPRVQNGSKTKPPSAQPVVNVDDEDDSETEVATLPKGKASSAKAGITVPPHASKQSAKPSSHSGTNGHASTDGASDRPWSVPSKHTTGAQSPRRTEEEWENILKHVMQQARDWEAKFIELARARETAMEESLRTFKREYEEQMSVLQEQNELLISQRDQMIQLAEQGQNSALTLFTQDAPNIRLQYEEKIQALREEVDMRDDAIAEKDNLLKIRETELQTLRSDLKAEVNQNKNINTQLKALRTAPATPSVPAQPTRLSHSPTGSAGRIGELEAAILLYEELSRVLILASTRIAEGQFKYICAIHHANQSDHTLRFSLADVVAPEGGEDTKDQWYLYTPLDRSSFSNEQLKYFHTQFRFPKHQALDLMLQLLELLDYKLDGDGEDDAATDEDEIQEVSHT